MEDSENPEELEYLQGLSEIACRRLQNQGNQTANSAMDHSDTSGACEIQEIDLDEAVSVTMDHSHGHNDTEDYDNYAGDDLINDDGDMDPEEEDQDEEDQNDEEENDDDFDEFDQHSDVPPYGTFIFRNLLQRGEHGEGLDSRILDVMLRLVSGMEGSPFERQLSEYDHSIDNLNQREDTYLILETLNELLERLLMMNGITAERVISPNKLARALVGILKDPLLADDLELHLVACRCLYNFIEVNQDFIHDALSSDAVEVLVRTLLEITYIDLTEQALQTLEMISREPSSHSLIITSNGLKACLQNLDFLTIHAQRKCLTIVANACTNIPTAHFEMIVEEFGKLAAVAETHTDGVVLENTWLAISRIVISFKMRPDFLERLFLDESILTQMATVVCSSCNPSSTELGLKYQSNISLIKSLIILASSSVKISLLLLHIRIGLFIGTSLSKFKKSDDQRHKPKISNQENRDHNDHYQESEKVSIEALFAAPKELTLQFLYLIGYLLPITYSPNETPFLNSNHKDHELKRKMNLERAALYRGDCFEDYSVFVNDVWLILVRSFQATMDYEIRRSVLISIFRITSFNEGENFSSIRGISELTGILASIITTGRSMFAEAESEKLMDIKQPLGSSRQDMLLLSAVTIALKVLLKSMSWLSDFQREGIFSDMQTVLDSLKSMFPDIRAIQEEMDGFYSHDEAMGRKTTIGFTNAFYNKFVDKELTRDSEYNHIPLQTYKELRIASYKLENLYGEIQKLNTTSQLLSGVFAELLSALENLSLTKSLAVEEYREFWIKLKDVVCSKSSSVSTFELISLGIITQTFDLLSSEDEVSFGSMAPQITSFLQVFYDDPESLIRLVDLLQDSLTRSESLEVVTSGGNPINGDSNAVVMTRQIKLKLAVSGSCEQLIPAKFQQFTLSVHSIATFKSIVAFLEQRFIFLDRVNNTVLDGVKSSDSEIEDGLDGSVSTGRKPLRIGFFIGDESIPVETTIYGAIYRAIQREKGSAKVDPQEVWAKPHTVYYRLLDSSEEAESQRNVPIYENILEDIESTTGSILKLLKVLFQLNQHMIDNSRAALAPEKFMNWKLTVKLNRQLEESLIVASGTLPNWSILLTREYPFIFPLATRMFFLQSTSFGYSRLIHNWQLRTSNEQSDEQNRSSFANNHFNGLQLGRPLRRKVRISRTHILQSALKVLQLYGSSPGVLEIEYFDEVGSGLGPTLEFYSSVSNEFCSKSLLMWRDESDNTNGSQYVVSQHGLFPRPMDQKQIESENGQKVLFLFSALGTFVARSLLDSRIVDIPFNIVFLKLIQNESSRLLSDGLKKSPFNSMIKDVDLKLASSIHHLTKFFPQNISEEYGDMVDKSNDTVENLSLSFVLPGYPKYELIPGGAEISVTSANLEMYLDLVVDATVYSGVIHQVRAFMQGFSKVFPITSMAIFTANELSEILGKSEEDWTKETLADAIKANHGYNRDSSAIHRLIDVLSSFSELERRKFSQFLTGSPKLPIGGFKAIRPEFTVVKKRAEDGLSSDDYLPSVMTCANYLKLPDYTLEELMREQLMRAITEGAGAFHLS